MRDIGRREKGGECLSLSLSLHLVHDGGQDTFAVVHAEVLVYLVEVGRGRAVEHRQADVDHLKICERQAQARKAGM
jgi:hypothetical protein